MNAFLKVSFAPCVTRDRAEKLVQDLDTYLKVCGNASLEVAFEEAPPGSSVQAGRTDRRLELHSPLTPREREVLSYVAQGFRNKEIGATLSITEQAVKNHIVHISDKLNIHGRVALALYHAKHDAATAKVPDASPVNLAA